MSHSPEPVSYPPEPWRFLRYKNVEYNGPNHVTIDHAGNGSVFEDVDEETARRIVACMNFCRGLPTEMLSQFGALGGLLNGRYSDIESELRFFIRYGVIRPLLFKKEEPFGEPT